MSWTEERINELVKLWKEGLSASQIAGRIGGVTRNACLSKIHRLGMADRAPGTKRRGGPMAPRVPGNAQKRPPRPKRDAAPVPVSHALFGAEPLPQTEELVIPVGERKSLIELEEHDCRWPIGDPRHPDFHFCGKAKVPGLPYCEFHARKSFQPPAKRKSRSREEVETELMLLRQKQKAKEVQT